MSHFFAYIGRMKNIRRGSLMRSNQEENVQEHSLQVAMIAHCLALIENKRYGGTLNPEHVMALAVFHETAEVITGDLVTPIKYYNDIIRSAYKDVEEMAQKRMLSMLPEDMREESRPLIQSEDAPEYRYVKAADKIAAYLKCLEELRTGNQEFYQAKQTLRKAIFDMNMPCAEDFLMQYAPSFEITLDELNKI